MGRGWRWKDRAKKKKEREISRTQTKVWGLLGVGEVEGGRGEYREDKS